MTRIIRIAKDKQLRGQSREANVIAYSGKSYCRGRLSTVDLLVLTKLDQIIFILKIYFLQNKLPE
jgi:hypothetical protein